MLLYVLRTESAKVKNIKFYDFTFALSVRFY